MKKQLLIASMAITAAACGAFGFAACGDTTDGAKEHRHELTLTPASNATCTTDGNSAYYTCNGCDKWFEDANGETEITDKSSVTLAKGHKLTLTPKNDATCTTDGNSAYYTCSVCDKWFADENGITEITDKTSVTLVKGHKLTLTHKNDATCTTNGNSAYYTCNGCDKWFEDKNGEHEITDKTSVVIPKLHSNMAPVEAVEATCTTEGNVAYYPCESCGKWFEDKNGATEITEKSSVVLEKLPHSYKNGICDVCGDHEPTEGLEYTLSSNKNYYICSGIGTADATDVVIAATYENKPVTNIENNAFRNNTNLTSIFIPDSITSIGNDAFGNCSGLESVTLSGNVNSIGLGAFVGCTALTEINYLGDIGSWCAITGLGSLNISTVYIDGQKIVDMTRITIPDGVTTIQQYAFKDCDKLTGVTIPDSVVNIYGYAFSGCRNLESVTLPKNLKYLGESVFQKCTSLTEIKIPDGVKDISGETFKDCYNLTSVTLPEGLTIIRLGAFKGCLNLTEIKLPNSLTTIGSNAFDGCRGLTKISIPDNVTTIGLDAFVGCTALTKINYEGDIASWCGISGLRNVDLSLIYFGEQKLQEMTEVTIPDGVTSVAEFAFDGCTALTSLKISDDVTNINDYAFRNCISLKSVTLPDGLKFIGTYVFENCKSLTKITIPEGVSKIKEETFRDCENLTSVIIPASVTAIDYRAFYNCVNLTEIKLPENLTSIGQEAFSGCGGLTSITIPVSVTTIGFEALHKCSNLTSITFQGTIEQWNEIKKGGYWNTDTGNYTIHCTNGDIEK